ncbi:adhesion G-protein coupled receptor G6-like [Octopus vulgaris]|uniref:Adhesion G-protein coupled receptor G6-like n=1 Tax=Octopus vulgaris TaxID=6645 RepID=A0AA36C2Z6_OCTVU|nr:adhesion G-protein coupled receptor G6-like [Octopus vulgaris]
MRIGSCNEDTTSNNGIFHWPVTKIGSNATIPGHANVATRLCSSRTVKHPEMASSQSRTSLKCSPFTGIWQEPDMSQCYNTEWITRRLKDIRSQDIDQRNIANIWKEVLNVSQKSVYFKQQDIALAVDILEKMVPLNASADTRLKIIRGVNNMINTPEKVLAEAELSNRSVSRMLDIIKILPETIPLEEQQVNVSYSNLGIGVAKVTQNSSAKGNTEINSQNADNPECVSWEETSGEDPHWATKGCKISDYVPGKKVVCSCDHLTSFALLMDVYRNEDDRKNDKSLSVISNIGCGLSFVCLVLTVIIHVCFK